MVTLPGAQPRSQFEAQNRPNFGVKPRPETAPTQCFYVVAARDPSALPRVLEVFAKLGLVPAQCHATTVGVGEEELHIDLQFRAMTADAAEHMARCLRGLYLVDTVLTSEKRRNASA